MKRGETSDRDEIIRKRLASIQGPSIAFKRSRPKLSQQEDAVSSLAAGGLRKRDKSSSATKSDATSCISSPYGRCPNVSERYKKIGRIGEGTYGIVYKAVDKYVGMRTSTSSSQHEQEYVALKRCLPHHEASDGFPITTLREIQLLREIAMDNDSEDGGGGGHENIIKLKEVAVGSNSSAVFLVFEYVHFDLAKLIDEHFEKYAKSPFKLEETKCLASQLLSALEYLHSKCIIHRDLKLSNMLYCKNRGQLKLADFGLARRVATGDGNTGNGGDSASKSTHSYVLPSSSPKEHLTPKVVSLWYRSPELLLQAESYNMAVDQWAAGCAIAELILGKPLFPGRGEINQLAKIVSVLGAPSIKDWPDLVNMPLFRNAHGSGPSCELPFRVDELGVGHEQASSNRSTANGKRTLLDIFSDLSSSGIDLFTNLLSYDPERRRSAKQARQSNWFIERPRPTAPAFMPKFENKL